MSSFLQSITAKRNGDALADEGIIAFVQDVIADDALARIPDYQAAPFPLAVYFRGFNGRERHTLLLAPLLA